VFCLILGFETSDVFTHFIRQKAGRWEGALWSVRATQAPPRIALELPLPPPKTPSAIQYPQLPLMRLQIAT
jgi:hypothetical protein